jgi:hypothetical protein
LVVEEEEVMLVELWMQILEEAAGAAAQDFLVILQEMQHRGKEILEELEAHHLEVMLAVVVVVLEVLEVLLLVLMLEVMVEMDYLSAFLESQQLMPEVVVVPEVEHQVVEDLEEEDLEDHLELVMELQEL